MLEEGGMLVTQHVPDVLQVELCRARRPCTPLAEPPTDPEHVAPWPTEVVRPRRLEVAAGRVVDPARVARTNVQVGGVAPSRQVSRPRVVGKAPPQRFTVAVRQHEPIPDGGQHDLEQPDRRHGTSQLQITDSGCRKARPFRQLTLAQVEPTPELPQCPGPPGIVGLVQPGEVVDQVRPARRAVPSRAGSDVARGLSHARSVDGVVGVRAAEPGDGARHTDVAAVC